MRGRTVSAWLTGVALVGVLAIAATAFAATQVNLKLTTAPTNKGTYGTEIVLQPSMDATAYPGDVIDFQQLLDDGTWEKWGEGLAVEETITPQAGIVNPDPLYVFIDESLAYPAVLRSVYAPKGSQNASAVSNPVIVRMDRNKKTSTKLILPATAKKGRSFAVDAQVRPISGVGTVRVMIKKVSGGKAYRKVMRLSTDEEGFTSASLNLKQPGRYAVTAKFVGNRFGVASPTATKYVVVR